MTTVENSRQKIEAYLGKLRQRLRGLDDTEVRDILEELRSHILDKAMLSGEVNEASIDAALFALGSPEKLASEYETDHLLARAEVSKSPVRILKSLFRWASLSVAGFFIFLSSVVGYFFGVVLVLVAFAKLIHPRTAGLWRLPSSNDDFSISFRLGFGTVPVGGKELLGWWIVPLGWLAGFGVVMLTTGVAVWFVRQYRRSLLLSVRHGEEDENG